MTMVTLWDVLWLLYVAFAICMWRLVRCAQPLAWILLNPDVNVEIFGFKYISLREATLPTKIGQAFCCLP